MTLPILIEWLFSIAICFKLVFLNVFFFLNDGKGEALMVKPFLRVYPCLLLKIGIFLQRAVSAFTHCTFIQYCNTGWVSILDFILDCNKFPGLTVNQGQQQHDFPLVDECKRSSICVTAEQDLQLVPSLKSRCSATSSEAKWLGAEEMAADGRKKLGFFFLVRGSDG